MDNSQHHIYQINNSNTSNIDEEIIFNGMPIQHRDVRKTPTYGKPSESYAHLITKAIMSDPNKRLALSGIYSWILENYPYFQHVGNKWKNSIRHNLSVYDCFRKIPKSRNAIGKGSYWIVDLETAEDIIERNNRKIRRNRHIPDTVDSIRGTSGGRTRDAVHFDQIDFDTGMVKNYNHPTKKKRITSTFYGNLGYVYKEEDADAPEPLNFNILDSSPDFFKYT